MTSPRSVSLTPAYVPRVDQHLESEMRLARLVEDVSARLRTACAGMPAEDFDALVREIACRKLRWAAAD